MTPEERCPDARALRLVRGGGRFSGHWRLCDLTNPSHPSYDPAYVGALGRWLAEPDPGNHVPHPPDTVSTPAPARPPRSAWLRSLSAWDFVTSEQLARDTVELFAMLPPDVDAVVAVARSGLFVGAPLASYLHVPLWSVSRQRGVQALGHGVRLGGPDQGPPRHVVLVDDTAASGREMRANVPAVREAFPGAEVTRATVYCAPEAADAVDVFPVLYPGTHYLEWNWPNAGHGEGCGYDFDGVLCRDGDGRKPRFLPRRMPVPLVVTGRHESARGVTQAWLDRWGVRVERLVMRDFGDPHDYSGTAELKARHYGQSPLRLFAESDPGQARRINELTGKAVLCPDAGRVFPPRAPVPAAAPAPALPARPPSPPVLRLPDPPAVDHIYVSESL